MTRSRITTFLGGAAVIALAVIAGAGCGSSSSSSASGTTHPTTANGRPATVGVAGEGKVGKILVDSQGRTLYLFKKDTGTKSMCSGACAAAWPPLRASGKPTVGSGANSAMIATTGRPDGTQQVTYNGHPLYRFGGDQKAGQTNGQGVNAFGASWFAVSPAGNQVTRSAGNSGGGGGY
jgi:predicted lipoprotein with Yx(FWY)xxD motif